MSGSFYVYILRYPNGKPFYVGMGCRSRIDNHEWSARKGARGHRYNIIRKIWAAGGSVLKEKIAIGLSQESAWALEIETIEKIGRRPNGPLVNLTRGGDGAQGYRHDLVSRAKMSQARDGYKWSEETRAKMAGKGCGRTVSAEVRKRIGDKLSGGAHWAIGKKMSDRHKAALHGANQKRVMAEGVIYESIKRAAECVGVVPSSIHYRIKTRKSGYQYL